MTDIAKLVKRLSNVQVPITVVDRCDAVIVIDAQAQEIADIRAQLAAATEDNARLLSEVVLMTHSQAGIAEMYGNARAQLAAATDALRAAAEQDVHAAQCARNALRSMGEDWT
jgi:hypothetical protein